MSPQAQAASAPSARLLVVDDEPDLRTLYELTLVREGYDVESAGSVEEAWLRLQEQGPGHYQLVITDMRLPDGNGLDLLRRLDNAGRSEKAIVITAYGSPENAVEALKAGAYDYLTKPVDLRQFRAVVASALGRMPVPASPARAPAAVGAASATGPAGMPAALHPALRRIVGEAPSIQQVRGLVERVAQSMAPVLVCGESGTGKELVARAVHEVSPRGALPFVAVNCGAIPENLLEAEFFGYRKGAFTGANEDRDGFFQAAQGGTLFLDEIGDLPLPMQSKLLRVIQERAVRPLGATAETPFNVRIVSATHKDLAAEVQAGRFRQDLFYRLNVIRITVPPLRERLGDLPALCGSVLQRIARDAGVSPVPTLAPEALQHLVRYGFPGNVRELENLLHRALALADGTRIGQADLGLPEAVLGDGVEPDSNTVPAPLQPLAGPVRAPAPAGGPALPTDLAAHLDSIERDILERALERHRYNRTAAGASLGLSLRQMRYRMARLGVGAADNDAD
ncbi:sigma-54-dependent transcriptional regulator [Rubrivivax rivuli]|uniref:Sigma-54-dependent Fis family transcriptional regulator n=1 Tax=Rubrivivax rivuli TaxID=1862385 RepID=A0A437R9H7_9BURK|nr:sigma-54 dependent transcriptional regulator [Rubrivivax rivuli]RVU43393.1 sigma-54-dependent Fis family transcriptional regulator [Rubrivivax rivuli]